MTGFILALAFASLAGTGQQNSQTPPPSIDPKFDKAPDDIFRRVPFGRNGRQLQLDEGAGRCYFIATRPVKPGPDSAIIRDIPSAPPIDNMPVVKPGPTCSSVR